jgi:hypothetical protein
MKKPVKPVRKYKQMTPYMAPKEPSKVRDVMAYRLPSSFSRDIENWDNLSDKEKGVELMWHWGSYGDDAEPPNMSQDDIDAELKSATRNAGYGPTSDMKKVEEYLYTPASCDTACVTLAELLANVPKSLIKDHPERITIQAESQSGRDNKYPDVYLEVHYDIPNPDYEEEHKQYEADLKEYNRLKAAWKAENPIHKERMAKYREDTKKYNEWRTTRISELEAAGEL